MGIQGSRKIDFLIKKKCTWAKFEVDVLHAEEIEEVDGSRVEDVALKCFLFKVLWKIGFL